MKYLRLGVNYGTHSFSKCIGDGEMDFQNGINIIFSP